MSTEMTPDVQAGLSVVAPLSVGELAAVLVKHYGLHEGQYDLQIEFQIGTGAVGPDPRSLLPGALIGLSRVGLVLSQATGPTTVDAARVNPRRKMRGKLST